MRRWTIAVLSLLPMLLSSCLLMPRVLDSSGVDVKVERLTPNQALMAFGGAPKDPNPYRQPGGLLMGRPDELVVLRLTIAANRRATMHVDRLEALDESGDDVARYRDKQSYLDYIGSWVNDLTYQNLEIVRDTYLPNYDFVIRPGTTTYYAVLIGKNPIARPFTVSARVGVDDLAPRDYSMVVEGK